MGPGKRRSKFGKFQNSLLQGALFAIGAKECHAGQKVRRGLRKFILQKPCQNILCQKLDFPFVRLAKGRVQADFVKMVPHQKEAETVDCGNLGMVNQGGGPLDLLRIGLRLPHPGDACGDALLHFRGGGPGKSHHQQLVNVHRVRLVCDHADNPLRQHCRLAAAGCSRDQKVCISFCDHPLLGGGKCNGCHFISPRLLLRACDPTLLPLPAFLKFSFRNREPVRHSRIPFERHSRYRPPCHCLLCKG